MALIKFQIRNGIHQDFDKRVQPEGYFRNSENADIISTGDKSFSWQNIDGNIVAAALCSHDKLIPIGGFRHRDRIIVFSARNDNLGYGEIGEIVISKDGSGTYFSRYCSSDLGFTLEAEIDGYGYWENDKLDTIYWKDKNNAPRALNLALCEYVLSGSVEDGKKYLVLCDHIYYNGVKREAGTYFTAVGITVFSGQGKVVEYVPVEMLDWTPKVDFAGMTLDSIISSGDCYCGKYYFTMKFDSINGIESDWSFLTNHVQIVPESGIGGDKTVCVSYVNKPSTVKTTKGIRLKIENIDTNWSNIKIAVFFANDFNSLTTGKLIFNGPVTGTEMFIDYLGNESFGQITIDDVNISTIGLENIQTLSNLKKRNDIANITETGEFENNITATLTHKIYELPTDALGNDLSGTPGPLAAHTGHTSNITTAGRIYSGQWYKAMVTPTQYGPTLYSTGDIFQGIQTHTNLTSGSVLPIIRIQKYYDQSISQYEYRDIEIPKGFLDYRNSLISHFLTGYRGDETYRIGAAFVDKRNKFKFVRWLGDIKFPSRKRSSEKMLQGYRTDPFGNNLEYNLRVLSLIVNELDITDIKDEISGFYIVRAPLDAIIISEGILHSNTATSSNKLQLPYHFAHGSLYRVPYYNVYYTPEIVLNYPSAEIDFGETDRMEIITFLKSLSPVSAGTLNYLGNVVYGGVSGDHFQKFYNDNITGHNSNVGDNAEIKTASKNPSHGTLFEANTFENFAIYPGGSEQGDGLRNTIVKLDKDYLTCPGPSYSGAIAEPTLTYVKHIRPKNNLYSGTTDEALEATNYMSTGHFQPINANVLAQIYNPATQRYVFNGIQVFGGDCFMGIFDMLRLYRDHTVPARYSHGILFPVQSRINVALRGEWHFSKDITKATNDTHWDESYVTDQDAWYYNGAFSTNLTGEVRPGLPVNFILNNIFERRHRFSELKFEGSRKDMFRVFLANNYQDLESAAGAITRIKGRKGKLYFWQQRAIGYLPMGERALIKDNLGSLVQLGVGGTYDRYDETHDFKGLQHYNAWCETDDGFAFVDFAKRSICYMRVDFELSELSTVKGLDNFMNNDVPDIFSILPNYDNPISEGGIKCGYEPRTKQVHVTFRVNSFRYAVNFFKTLVFDTKLGSFLDFRPYTPPLYFTFDNFFYSIQGNDYTERAFYIGGPVLKGTIFYDSATNTNYIVTENIALFTKITPACQVLNRCDEIFIHRQGEKGKFYGLVYPSKIVIIFRNDDGQSKIFDWYELTGNDQKFTNFTFSNRYNSLTEETTTSRFPKQVRDKWYGNIPISSSKGRIRDDEFIELELEFKNSSDELNLTSKNELIKLLRVDFNYRKLY